MVNQSKLDHRKKLDEILNELAAALKVFKSFGFSGDMNPKDPYSLVLESSKTIGDKGKCERRKIHRLAKKLGLRSVSDRVRILRPSDGDSGHVMCLNCSFTASVYEDECGHMHPVHRGLSCQSLPGMNGWCGGENGWDRDDVHKYPYYNVIGRVIVWHPYHQPRLSNQSHKRLESENRNRSITTAMLCLGTMNLPRDVSYIIVNIAYTTAEYKVRIRRRTAK